MNFNLKSYFKKKNLEFILILIGSILLLYSIIALYFINHYFPNTIINNVDVSLKSYRVGEKLIQDYIKDYVLTLIERNDAVEYIKGTNIKLHYNSKNSLGSVHQKQQSLKWITSLFSQKKYYVMDLYSYNEENLSNVIDDLKCINQEKIIPVNVGFQYKNGSYHLIKEEKGNVVIRSYLDKAIQNAILKGMTRLNLEKSNCYEEPRFTTLSPKTEQTRKMLNHYASTEITYHFGEDIEKLDGTIISDWLMVDNNLDVEINARLIRKYVTDLSKKYDTVGVSRKFKTSTGKLITISGGLYGWKINKDKETEAIINHIMLGEKIDKEPEYSQKAFGRGTNEIGKDYVEINITRQYLWLYKDGKVIAQGSVVTGNPNKGNATVLGVNMLNYKQNGAKLTGPGYEVGVTYWMPFYGNIGIHDAKWRRTFGGKIYKTNGTHGCVNTPLYLAKIIYENIYEGMPIISYEE